MKTSRTFVSSSVDDASLTCRQLPEHGLAGADVPRSHDVAAHHRVHLHDEGVAVGARPVDQVVLLRRCRCRCRGQVLQVCYLAAGEDVAAVAAPVRGHLPAEEAASHRGHRRTAGRGLLVLGGHTTTVVELKSLVCYVLTR